jgi:hypothetical protein
VTTSIELDAEGGRNVDRSLIARRVIEMSDRPNGASDLACSREDIIGQRGAAAGKRGKADLALLKGEVEAESAVEGFENVSRCLWDSGPMPSQGRRSSCMGLP